LSTLAVDGLLFLSARAGYILNLIIAVFNLVPLQAAGGFVWDGKRIFNWNRIGWLLLCAAVGVLVILDIMVK
jgi:Zn-dependent protease